MDPKLELVDVAALANAGVDGCFCVCGEEVELWGSLCYDWGRQARTRGIQVLKAASGAPPVVINRNEDALEAN